MAPWWHCAGTLAARTWHRAGTHLAPCWHPRGPVPAPCPGAGIGRGSVPLLLGNDGVKARPLSVEGDVVPPFRRHGGLVEDRRDGALRGAGLAVDTVLRVDV